MRSDHTGTPTPLIEEFETVRCKRQAAWCASYNRVRCQTEDGVGRSLGGYRDDTSPYVTSPYVSSPCDTSLYVISRHFYVPICFIPEVWGPYSGLG